MGFRWMKGFFMAHNTTNYEAVTPTPSDIRGIMGLWRRSWLATYPNSSEGVPCDWVDSFTQDWLDEDELVQREQHLEERIKDPQRFTRIIKDGDVVIASLFGVKHQGKQKLQRLYVDTDFHGTDISHSLMGEFLDWCATEVPIELEVARYTGRARSFYEKYGFTLVENSEHLFLGKIPCISMVREAERS